MKTTTRVRNINVTQSHINRSKKLEGEGSSQYCPIALAVKEATHKCVAVGSWDEIHIGDATYEPATPQMGKQVSQFIDRVDDGKWHSCRPFKLVLKKKDTF